jgi:hypothetical protein
MRFGSKQFCRKPTHHMSVRPQLPEAEGGAALRPMALFQYARSALQPKYMPVNTRPNNPINGIVEPVFGSVA